MEMLSTLKTLHVAATVLLLLSGLGLGFLTYRKQSDGLAVTLRRPWIFVWCLLLVCMFSLPFTGWWLVHLLGWPLGVTWILASSLIYTVAAFSTLWLLARLNRLRIGGGGNCKLSLALAIVSGVGFLAIAALMGAKPV